MVDMKEKEDEGGPIRKVNGRSTINETYNLWSRYQEFEDKPSVSPSVKVLLQ